MWSKIIGIVLTVVLALGLVGGSAYILLRPSEAQARYEGSGQGRAAAVQAGEARGDPGRGREDASGNGVAAGNARGGGQNRGAGADQGEEGGGWHGGERESKGAGVNGVDSGVKIEETVTGTVVALDRELLIETPDGELEVKLCPDWYWESVGIALEPGDEVVVTGFYDAYDEDHLEAVAIENLTSGESVTLRDEDGRPMWAGQGRQGR